MNYQKPRRFDSDEGYGFCSLPMALSRQTAMPCSAPYVQSFLHLQRRHHQLLHSPPRSHPLHLDLPGGELRNSNITVFLPFFVVAFVLTATYATTFTIGQVHRLLDALENTLRVAHVNRTRGVTCWLPVVVQGRKFTSKTLTGPAESGIKRAVTFCHSVPIIGTNGEDVVDDFKKAVDFRNSESASSRHLGKK